MEYQHLKKYGLSAEIIQTAENFSDLCLGRVIRQNRGLYDVVSEKGEFRASVSGKLFYLAIESGSFPAVGDWVMTGQVKNPDEPVVIHRILPRKSIFERKAAGTSGEVQIVAANIDTVFLCMSLNQDFNLRRMERYLTIAWDSGAAPVIVLTKSDLCDDLARVLQEVSSVGMFTEFIVCSAVDSDGLDSIARRIRPGEMVAFIGSSGVGKSTLVNRLAGQELLTTHEVRADDDKGRHTTTRREMIVLPNGGIVIDTPGMRELQLAGGNLSMAFEDIEALAASCRFGDCRHKTEPGCAVRKAVETGALKQNRLDSYFKLQNELSYDGLNARERENKKIERMFGGKTQFKQLKKEIKNKNKGRS